MSLFPRLRWVVLDCLTGNAILVTHVPFSIGSQDSANLPLLGPAVFGRHCEICHTKEHGFALMKIDPEGEMIVNGMAVDFAPLRPNEDYSLKIGRHLLVIRGDKHPDRWRQAVNHLEWTLFAPGSATGEGPLPLPELCRYATAEAKDLHSSVIPKGVRMGFYLHQAIEAVGDGGSLRHGPLPEPAAATTLISNDGLPVAELVEDAAMATTPPLPIAEPVAPPPLPPVPLPPMPSMAPEFTSDVPIDVGEPCEVDPKCWTTGSRV
ncbi:MAG: hypothetical protein KA191_03810 [Verrucomicrobia bacterium]|jgi:hypothetical protein|nr:hypothetical protein [Verrucomicrobiota bacterium]OQC67444.1 MAG: hypothetical protein BWX48_00809 [Verrucomicrobia bacterium ADurb.Bin006]MDI9380147.1 FHA domain-containing protein [Verrucomicrobiota bacterium]NMD21361.1 hypothetical protein [Verrucomicrobiota bacterium]HOA60052.1 FHA domain-containing protein [Verrucomicrobiota bacterium]